MNPNAKKPAETGSGQLDLTPNIVKKSIFDYNICMLIN